MTYLQLSLRKDLDYPEVLQDLKRTIHKRSRSKTQVWPFEQSMASTGDVLTIKGDGLGEVGALTLAAEFTRGACPMLEQLLLKDCRLRNEGLGRLLQGVKMANLLNLRVLQLRGNFLSGRGIEYLHETCRTGILANLQVLILSDNELHDDGVDKLCAIISEGLFSKLVELQLQHNSITDKGFSKMMKLLKSVQETRCPFITRLGLDNNLVSAEAKRKYSPYPFYMSI